MRDELKVFAAAVGRVFDPPDPIVEIGSLQTPGQVGYADLRPDFVGREYIGCDIVEGPGVDRIEDVRAMRFADGAVGAVLAMDSLEHVADPALAVTEMRRVVAPGGVVAIGAPFLFPIHHDPDFHRFSPEGLSRLLGSFAHVATFAIGDAQWPHTVAAVATDAMTGDEFEARIGALTEAWYAAGLSEPLARFQPVESVLRHANVYATPLILEACAPYEEVLVCPRSGLCRIDVRLALAAADERPAQMALTLIPEDDVGEGATAYVPGGTLGEGRWMSFTFPPLASSAQRAYRLRLEAMQGRATVFLVPEGGLTVELFVSRPVVPLLDATPKLDRDVGSLRIQNEALIAEVRRLEAQVRALRASAGAPWWARLLGRRGPVG